MLLLLRKEKFGPSSEKITRQMEGQLSLFNEAEIEANESVAEPLIARKGCFYNRNKKIGREELLKDFPVLEISRILSAEEMVCRQCGGILKEIGFTKVRDELEYVPAKVRSIKYMRQACECPAYKHKIHPFIKKADTSTSVLNHSLASPSLVVRVSEICKQYSSLQIGKGVGTGWHWP